ncbi:MAG TPA: alpha/beta hydrolase [Chitinispirillaceae bacterium]|nr:alpha/beta hydrolase [Chitinispirillaceae bacterium]
MKIKPVFSTLPPLSLQPADLNHKFTKTYLSFYGLNFTVKCYCHGIINNGETSIFVQIFQPGSSKATVLLSHGLFDHSALFRHVISCCLDQNYTVITLDYPGHGLSSGSLQMYEDFSLYADTLSSVVEFCKKHLPEPLHLLGHSTGCSAIMELLITRPLYVNEITSVLFLAPLVRPVSWHILRIAFWILHGKVFSVPRAYHCVSSDTSFVKFYRNDPLHVKRLPLIWVQSLLNWNNRIANQKTINKSISVIQGTYDQVVDWRYNLPALKTVFKVKTTQIPQGKHHLHNEIHSLRQKTLKQIVEYLG